MKKNRLLLVLSIASIGLLASCGEPAADESSSVETPSSSSIEDTSASSSTEKNDGPYITEPTEITFWSTSSYDAEIADIIERFKEVEPNITVTASKYSGSYDDLKTKIVQGIPANNYPDMFLGYPDAVQEIMNYNKVVQLDEYINNADYGWTEEDLEDILPAYLQEGQLYPIPGTWSVPAAKSTEAMFYSKKLIGIDLSSYDETINGGKPIDAKYLNNLSWEELFGNLCPALVKYNDGLDAEHKIYNTDYDYHGIFGYDSDSNLFITLAEQYGYGYTSIDPVTGEGQVDFVNDGMKSLMKMLNEAANNGYLITQGTAAGHYTNFAFVAQSALFSVGSTGGSKYQDDGDDKFETGVAKIPHAKNGDAKVINQGPSIAVLDHDDDNRALASWLFYRFFANEQNAEYWAINTGYSPIRYSVYETDDYLDYSDSSKYAANSADKLYAEVATYVGTVMNDYYSSPVFKGSSTARTQAGSIVTQVLNAKTDLTDEKLDEIFNTAKTNVELTM